VDAVLHDGELSIVFAHTINNHFVFSSVRLKIEQNQLVIDGRCTCSGGIGLQGA
jgi:hypothetical protein